MAPHIEGAERQYLIEARPVVKILHAKLAAVTVLRSRGATSTSSPSTSVWNSCPANGVDWSRAPTGALDRIEIKQQSARGKYERQADGDAHANIFCRMSCTIGVAYWGTYLVNPSASRNRDKGEPVGRGCEKANLSAEGGSANRDCSRSLQG